MNRAVAIWLCAAGVDLGGGGSGAVRRDQTEARTGFMKPGEALRV